MHMQSAEGHHPDGSRHNHQGDEDQIHRIDHLGGPVFPLLHMHEHEELKRRLDNGHRPDDPHHSVRRQGRLQSYDGCGEGQYQGQ
jgi:hypothetical protein